VLLGREQEQQKLRQLLATARTGRSSVVALVGEPGIGKSALLDDAEGAAAGMRVLRARGIQSEGEVPFGGLLELVRPALAAVPRIPAPQARALESALALRPTGAYDRFAVGAATLSLVAMLAEEAPLLVLVDDAQWLDAASAEALLFAVRRLLADPIAVVLAVREGEASLLDGSGLPSIRIGGLDRDAAGELLGALPASTVDRLHAATAGNPLALLELAEEPDTLATLPPEGPVPVSGHIAQAFLRRSASLSQRARHALLLAATSDTGDVATLSRAGLRVENLAEAEKAGLVRIADGTVRFRHALARSAVYAQAAPDERRAAHRILAEVLPDRDVDRRAWHLAAAAAGADAAAAAALEQAGQRARDRSAYSAASAAFERGARLDPDDARRGGLLYQAAESAWLGAAAERARLLLDEADLIAPHPHIDALRGQIATRRGPVMDGYELLVSAAERSEPKEAVLMLAEAADACFYSGAADRMLAAAERAYALAENDPVAQFYASSARGAALMVAGGDGAPDLRRALELYRRGSFEDDPLTLAWAAIGPLFLREAEAGRELIAHAIATAREHAAIGVLPRLLNRLARDEAMTDRWPDAEADFDETIRLAREAGQRTELVAALAGLAWLEGRQGREEACRAHAEEGRALARDLGVGFYELWTYTALGELELALGRPVEAIVELEAHEARAAELSFDDVDMSTQPELVDAYLRLGRTGEAEAAAEQHGARARSKGRPWALARAHRCLGMVADDFVAPFEAALAFHAETPDLFEAARTQLAYGARLRRSRRRVQARERLRPALEAFDRLGPSPWGEAARAELAATGETARRRDSSTLGDLTPQELQIALLLGSGKTTREAAAALFLSPKTIEYHLRSVYRKLGVNSRQALAQAVSDRR
jgi:DNA-binding CsgD family transcriptional regulator